MDDPKPVGRFDWERLVARAEMPKHLKALAFAIAIHANNDGSSVRVSRRLLADILDDSERTVDVNRQALVSMGFLILVKKGGGTNRGGFVNVYQLADPGPGFLIFRLDPDGNRLIERKVGVSPKRRTDAKSASHQSPVDNHESVDHSAGADAKWASHQGPTEAKPTADRSEAHFALPLLTTNPPLLELGNQLTSAPPLPVDNPNGVTGNDAPRAPPVRRVPPKPQPRKRKKR